MQVMLANHRARLAAGAAGQVPSLRQHHPARAHAGEVHGNAGPNHAASHDDDVRGGEGHFFIGTVECFPVPFPGHGYAAGTGTGLRFL